MSGSIVTSSNFLIQWLAGVAMVAGGAWAVVRWIHNVQTRAVEERVVARINEIKAEGAGNASLREAIERIEKKLDTLENDLIRHLGYHEGIEAKD
jgi:hypothetical protein